MKRIGLLVLLCVLPGVAWAAGDGANFTPKTDVTVTGTATLIAARNMSRAFLNCTNNSASVHVRWGDSTITSTKGQRFPAGAPIEITTPAAVYMISEGANVTVSCTEEVK